MQHDFWKNKWINNDIKFHLSEVNQLLISHFPISPNKKVLVPLCGKSLDMIWLLSKGHYVIGVELSEIACESFFIENNFQFTIIKKQDFKVYIGNNVEIWCGDIFSLPKEAYHDISLIYDRAALIALPLELRTKYVSQIKKFSLMNKIEMLLITIEYDQSRVDGPPFSVSRAMVYDYYSDVFRIDIFDLPKCYSNPFKDNPKFNGISQEEAVYIISNK